MEMSKSAAKSYAYLLGVYLGDGSVAKASGRYAQQTIDKDFADAVCEAVLVITGKKAAVSYIERPKKNMNCSPIWSVSFSHEIARKMVTDTDGKGKIPAYVFDWDDELKKEFVVGLMDSEGFVAAKAKTQWQDTNRSFYMGYKSCDVWVPDFIKIMESIGIRIGKYSVCPPAKPHYKTPTRFTIKMQSWVDSGCRFRIARKQDRVDLWASKPAYEMRVVANKDPIGICRVPGCGGKFLAKGLCGRHYSQRRLSSETNTPNAA